MLGGSVAQGGTPSAAVKRLVHQLDSFLSESQSNLRMSAFTEIIQNIYVLVDFTNHTSVKLAIES